MEEETILTSQRLPTIIILVYFSFFVNDIVTGFLFLFL